MRAAMLLLLASAVLSSPVDFCWSLARAQPPMTGPTTIDHGLRYPIRRWGAGTVQAVETPTGVLLCYGEGGEISCYRRGPHGEEIDRVPRAIRGIGVHGSISTYRWRLLDQDRLALISIEEHFESPRYVKQVLVREFDPRTLEPRTEPVVLATLPGAAGHPFLAAGGDALLAGWTQSGGTAHLVRLDEAYQRLDAEDRIYSNVDWERGVVGELGPDDGWVSFISLGGDAMAVHLDPSGAANDQPSALFPGGDERSIVISRVQDQWLAVEESWEQLLARWLGPDGPGPIFGAGRSGAHAIGLAMAAHDSIAAVVRRSGEYSVTVEATTVPKGQEWPSSEVTLDDAGTLSVNADLPHATDVVWAHGSFLALWIDSTDLPVSRERRDTLPPCRVACARLSEQGERLDPESVTVSVASQIYAPALRFDGEDLSIAARDVYTESVRIQLQLDRFGYPMGPAREYAIPNDSGENSYAGSYPLGEREWNGQQALVQSTSSSWWGDWGDGYRSQGIQVDQLTPDGEVMDEIAIGTYGTSDPNVIAYTDQADFAERGDSLFVAYDLLRYPDTDSASVHLRRARPRMPLDTEWVSRRAASARAPSVRPVPGGCLLVWSEFDGVRWALVSRVVKGAAEPGVLIGQPLLHEAADQLDPWLVDGVGQRLCLYRVPRSDNLSRFEVHGVRLGRNGRALDASPIVVSALPGSAENLTGVWDGLHYVVFWRSFSDGKWTLLGNRVTAGGRVLDGSGFAVASGRADLVMPAATPHGRVAVMYGDQLRFIEDAVVPIATDAPSARAHDDAIEIEWDLPSEYADADVAVFRRALEFAEEELHPPLGFLERSTIVESRENGRGRALDQSVEPGGLYAYCLRVEKDGDVSWSPASLARAASLERPSLRIAPNPLGGVGVLTLRLPVEVPRTAIEIIDATGRRVERVALGAMSSGVHPIAWPMAESRVRLANGIYLVRARVGDSWAETRVVIAR
ncbi:MAG: FlgD immunoglobulin-like domain containing protein [Candidatus Eisenbacteria bacterium]